MAKRTLYLIRHGQSESQVDATVCGIDPALTEKGERQARALKPRVEEINADLVLCSPLQRTRQTMALSMPKHEDVIFHGDLIESEWAGATSYPDDIYEGAMQAYPDAPLIKHSGTFNERVASLLDYLDEASYQRAIAFCHYGTINRIMTMIMGLEEDSQIQFHVDNTEIVIVHLPDNGAVIFDKVKH